MGSEALLLGVARRVVIVVVEPRLPYRHHLRMTGLRDQIRRADVELFVGVVRMGANRAEHVWKPLGDGDQIRLPPHPGRDRDHAADAGRSGALDHALEPVLEVGKIQMTVAVDQHGLTPSPLPARYSAETPAQGGAGLFRLQAFGWRRQAWRTAAGRPAARAGRAACPPMPA